MSATEMPASRFRTPSEPASAFLPTRRWPCRGCSPRPGIVISAAFTLRIGRRFAVARQGQELQLRHGEMLPVIGEKRNSVAQSDGGDGHVGIGKGLTLFLPVTAHKAGSILVFRRP